MKRVKKAVGYVCEIQIPGTDLVISKEDQRARILKHVQKENMELVCIYEDDAPTAEVFDRPGIQGLIDRKEPFDILLVERIWAISRKRQALEPLLRILDRRGVEVQASSYLWDCVSQQVRHRYAGNLAARARKLTRERAEAKRLRGVA